MPAPPVVVFPIITRWARYADWTRDIHVGAKSDHSKRDGLGSRFLLWEKPGDRHVMHVDMLRPRSGPFLASRRALVALLNGHLRLIQPFAWLSIQSICVKRTERGRSLSRCFCKPWPTWLKLSCLKSSRQRGIKSPPGKPAETYQRDSSRISVLYSQLIPQSTHSGHDANMEAPIHDLPLPTFASTWAGGGTLDFFLGSDAHHPGHPTSLQELYRLPCSEIGCASVGRFLSAHDRNERCEQSVRKKYVLLRIRGAPLCSIPRHSLPL